MNKKEWIAPVIVTALGLIFILVSAMVFFTKGKSAKWVSRKMKIGAILLTLSAASCDKPENGVLVTCYDPAPQDEIRLDAYLGDTLKLNLDTSHVLNGTIYGVTKQNYSFTIKNQDNSLVQAGNLVPNDGSFDSGNEDFTLEIDETINAGVYNLDIYLSNIDDQESAEYPWSIKLEIKED